jgi:hypothetical protein
VEKYCTARQATDENIIRRMRFACWITKATDTYSEYVILIAFPWQQWLRERASMLRLYVHCMSCSKSRSVTSSGSAEDLNLQEPRTPPLHLCHNLYSANNGVYLYLSVTNVVRVNVLKIELHYTTLHYTTLHYTTLHYTT